MSKLAKEEKDAVEILEFTSDLTAKYSNAKPELVTAVLGQRVEANLMRRKPFEAETDFGELEKLYNKHKVGISYYKNAVASLAMSFEDESKRTQDKDKALYDKLREKARFYRKRALELGGGKAEGFDSDLAMAVETYDEAEKKMEEGDAAGSKKLYKESRELLEAIIGKYKEQIMKHKDRELLYKLNHRLVRCYLGEGELAKANQVTDQMLQDAEDDIELIELKGDILSALARAAKGNEQVEKYKNAVDFYGKCAAKYKRVMGESDQYKTAYFRNLYKWCLTLFEFSDGQQRLANYFETATIRGEAPEWDGGEFKPKLNQLHELIKKKLPK
jgi:hypothetical protein